jgi:hypothetical protein
VPAQRRARDQPAAEARGRDLDRVLRAAAVLDLVHALRRLAVAQPLAELQERDQRQPPRRVAGLAERGVEVGEVAVPEHRTEAPAQQQGGVAARERRPGDAGGVAGDGRDIGLWAERHGGLQPGHPSTHLPQPRRDFANSVRAFDGP